MLTGCAPEPSEQLVEQRVMLSLLSIGGCAKGPGASGKAAVGGLEGSRAADGHSASGTALFSAGCITF